MILFVLKMNFGKIMKKHENGLKNIRRSVRLPSVNSAFVFLTRQVMNVNTVYFCFCKQLFKVTLYSD